MRSRTRHILRRLLATAAVGLLLLSLPMPAFGHDNVDDHWITHPYNGYDWYTRIKFDPQHPTPADMRTQMANGAKLWNAVGRDFVFSFSCPTSCPILVKFADLLWPNGDSWAIETNYKALGGIYSATLTMNTTPGGATWYAGTGTPGPGQGDVWTVAAHEFGHAVALNHSSLSADVMWPYIAVREVDRILSWHDKDGISWIYPDH